MTHVTCSLTAKNRDQLRNPCAWQSSMGYLYLLTQYSSCTTVPPIIYSLAADSRARNYQQLYHTPYTPQPSYASPHVYVRRRLCVTDRQTDRQTHLARPSHLITPADNTQPQQPLTLIPTPITPSVISTLRMTDAAAAAVYVLHSQARTCNTCP